MWLFCKKKKKHVGQAQSMQPYSYLVGKHSANHLSDCYEATMEPVMTSSTTGSIVTADRKHSFNVGLVQRQEEMLHTGLLSDVTFLISPASGL